MPLFFCLSVYVIIIFCIISKVACKNKMSYAKVSPTAAPSPPSLPPPLQVGSTIMPMSPDGLFPAVGMHSLGEEVRLHLNAELGREDDSVMMVDSYEDEWGRLHDVRVCGTVSKGQWGWAGGLGRTPVDHISMSELLRIGGEGSAFCKVLENGNFGRIALGSRDKIF